MFNKNLIFRVRIKNINVGLNTDATLGHIHVNAIDSINRIELINETGKPNAYNSKAIFAYSNDSTMLAFYPSKTNEAEFSLLELKLGNLRIQSMVGGNRKVDYFATQSYVANAISGAIAASY